MRISDWVADVCSSDLDDIFAFLAQPLVDAFGPGEGKLVYTKLYEAFFVEIRVAFFAAFFLAFPVIANQIWAFVAPGLYAKEKRAFLPFLIAPPSSEERRVGKECVGTGSTRWSS